MVTMYALSLAEALGMSGKQKKIIVMRRCCMISARSASPSTIKQTSMLTDSEREVIERHVKIADAIISQTPYLRGIAPIILHQS
jgi:HD-GYP domain-containing protein (c-di-GMP phosphodiesterase class II)